MRDGIACGLIIKSGLIPSSVKGISSSGIMRPKVPFCPAREAILSPIAGRRSSRTLTLATLNPSSPSVIKDLSTYPSCPFLGLTESSVQTSFVVKLELIFPIKIVLSLSSVFSFTKP